VRRFIVRENVARFQRLLARESDERVRRTLRQLLLGARRELAGLQGIWSWTCPELGIPDRVGVAAENLLDRIVEIHRADFASLQIWDEATHSLRLIAHFNFDRRSVERFAIVKDGIGTTCEAAQASQAPVFIADIEKCERFASLRGWTRAIGIRAIQTTPVFSRTGKFVGAYSTHYASPRSFTGAEMELSALNAHRIGLLFADLDWKNERDTPSLPNRMNPRSGLES